MQNNSSQLDAHLEKHYAEHIKTLQSRIKEVLERHQQADCLAIHSGQLNMVFMDDYNYPFKINPHFKHWLPVLNVTNCWLIVNGEDKPKLIYHQPVDFWHKVTPLEESYWTNSFDIVVATSLDEIELQIKALSTKAICISEHDSFVKELGFEQLNPKAVVDYLHYHRAYKTAYEMECMRRSNAIAIRGHSAAKTAFYHGKSEFEINSAYLNASHQTENELPYGNIVALNENSAILHYTHLDRAVPDRSRSFLIDAGATFHGYAADITRTYSTQKNNFSLLIGEMQIVKNEAIQGLVAGSSYVELHEKAYQQIAGILNTFDIIKCSAEEACETAITSTFFPHGLGHHLGLQTHDVAGFMQDEDGTHLDVPTKFSALRVSRKIEANQVFTIEPGLYFIDSLLADLKASGHSNKINWTVIDELRPYGGIRLEDNIIVHQSKNENITKEAGLA